MKLLILKTKLTKRKKKSQNELEPIVDLANMQEQYIKKRSEMDYDSDASRIRNQEML